MLHLTFFIVYCCLICYVKAVEENPYMIPPTEENESEPQALSAKDSCNEEIYKRDYPCGAHLTQLPGSKVCLWFSGNLTMSAEKSYQHCKSLGLQSLVEIPNADVDKTLQDLPDSPREFWTGMYAKRDTWVWLTNNKLVSLYNYTNWDGNPVPPDLGTCVVKSKDADGRWVGKDCREKHHFICQKDISTNHKTKASIVTKKVLVGEPVKASCRLVGDFQTRATFNITKDFGLGDYHLTFDSNWDDRVHFEDAEYVATQSTCVKSMTATLTIQSVYLMRDRHVSCCGFTVSGEPVCNKAGGRFDVKSLPGVPSLKVEYTAADRLSVHCSSTVATNGGLTWVLASPRQFWTWQTPWAFRISLGPTVDGVEMAPSEIAYDDSGLTMNQTMTIQLSRTFESSTVACFSSVQPNITNNVELHDALYHHTRQSHMFLIFTSQPPTLLTREEVFNGTKLTRARCSAYVGYEGVLTWSLRAGDCMITWDVVASASGDVTYKGGRTDDVTFDRSHVTFDLNNGTYLMSEITVHVNTALDTETSGNLTCYSYHYPHAHPADWERLNQSVVINKYDDLTRRYFTVSVARIIRVLLWIGPPTFLLVLVVACLTEIPGARRGDDDEDEGEDEFTTYFTTTETSMFESDSETESDSFEGASPGRIGPYGLLGAFKRKPTRHNIGSEVDPRRFRAKETAV